jgi:hypothetical protein
VLVLSNVRNTRKNIRCSSLTLDYSQTFIHVEDIDICHAVASKRSSEDVVHASVFWIDFLRYGRAHKEFHSQQFGFFAKAVDGRMKRKQVLPWKNIGHVVVWFYATSCKPDRVSVRSLWIWEAITVRGYDASDGMDHILIGCIWKCGHGGFDSECGHDMIGA